jgi:putative Mg2+ transporter-C (MgtC) family protein
MMVTVTLSPLVITEPYRVASNVMLGMLILGMLVLVRNKITVKKVLAIVLIWVSGAVGLAIGSGLFLEGILVAIVTFFLLNLLNNKIQSDL